MTTIPTHHLPEELLAAYAAGTTAEAISLVVACHLTFCPACRRRLTDLEALAGALLEAQPGAALATGALAATLSRLDEPRAAGRASSSSAPVKSASVDDTAEVLCPTGTLPLPLLRHLPAGAEKTWKRLLPGVKGVDLDLGGGEPPSQISARLVRLRPGMKIPLHDHTGPEYFVVFSGGLSEAGVAYHRGDVVHRDVNDRHQQRVLPGEACVALLVNEGQLVPLTFYGRMLARLVRL